MKIFNYLGHFHPLIVHLPLGIWSLILLLFLLFGREKLTPAFYLIRAMALICAISATVSAMSGYLLSSGGDYEITLITTHQYLAYVFTLVCWIAYLRLPYLLSCKVLHFRFWFIVGAALMILTGHAGGTITHGSGYMVPPPPASWFDNSRSKREVTPEMTPGEVAGVIFEEKCVSCHGSRKQKGELRLDTKEHIMKGGKDGKIIGDTPAHSLLIKNIHLPEEDDDHMPPKGRKQLSQNEIDFLTWWVTGGADYEHTLAELPLPDSLAAIMTPEHDWAKNELLPEKPVNKPDEKTITQLLALHAVVTSMGRHTNYLQINFLNVPAESTEKAIALLPALAPQLVELHLDDQKINDPSWSIIGKLHALRKLSLRNTNLDDQKLSLFHKMKNLKVLNLSGTTVSAGALAKNLKADSLMRLYLYQTNIDRENISLLQKQFHNVLIDTGNYRVSTIASDTSVFTKKDLENRKK